jgi:hypothetical protein
MTTEQITAPTIQMNYAKYQANRTAAVENLSKWNNEFSILVHRVLNNVIDKAGLPGEVTITNFEGNKILDFHLNDRLLAFVPAKNGKIGVCVTEGQEDEDTPPLCTPPNYHFPEEFKNQYLVLNYVNHMISILDDWDSQPD